LIALHAIEIFDFLAILWFLAMLVTWLVGQTKFSVMLTMDQHSFLYLYSSMGMHIFRNQCQDYVNQNQIAMVKNGNLTTFAR
jgi:hypothetical protein